MRRVQRGAIWAATALSCGADPSGGDASGTDDSPQSATNAASRPPPGSTATTGATTEDAASTGTTGGTGSPEKTVDVELFPGQPMVADITITTAEPAEIMVSHASDPGVVTTLVTATDEVQRFRVRGLRPASTHVVDCTVTVGADVVTDEIVFETPAALPGFLGAFPIEITDTPADSAYRFFDVMPLQGDHAGVAMVDAAGITRWYYGATSTVALPLRPITGAKLLDDGSVAFLQGHTAFVIDELGELVLQLSDEDLGVLGLHHEIVQLPGGNFLALSHSFASVDYPEQGTLEVAGDMIVEFTADGDVVWTWDTFDHLDPQRTREGFEIPLPHPETLELAQDWTHSNGIEYDEADDSIVLSIRHQDWMLKIDHGTGELLWRLGEEGDFTLDGDGWFFHPHSPQWQPDGSLVLYDNAVGNPGLPDDEEASRVLRYELDEATMTATQRWADDEPAFMSEIAGDIDRLPGGNFLVLDSAIIMDGFFQARLRELEPNRGATRIWTLSAPPDLFIYRATAHTRLVGEPR